MIKSPHLPTAALSAIVTSFISYGQSAVTGNLSATNHVIVEKFTSTGGASSIRDVVCYDGLGYPFEEISCSAALDGKSLVRPIVYDSMHRADTAAFLPYAETLSDGTFVINAVERQRSSYRSMYDDDYGYSGREYEPSPAGRVVSEMKAGMEYRRSGRKGTVSYAANGTGEAVAYSYAYDSSGNLTSDSRNRLEIQNNVLNLPMRVEQSSGTSAGTMGGTMTYTYLGDGTRVAARAGADASSHAGKEEQDIAGMDLGLLDFGARYYDTFTCRWNAVDPLAHKYSSMSPYNYCGNDPVNFLDPDGRDIFVFDAEGKYVETIEDDGEDYIQWNRVDSEGNEYVMNVSFVDPQNDPQKINKNTLLIAMSNDQIRKIIEGQGGFSCSTSDFIKESVGGGNFDYSVSVLSVYSNGAIEYDSTGSRKSSGNEMTSPALFIPEGQNYAHNLMNFGNFLWGATGCSLGISTTVLKAGAHGNSIINSAKNGYRPQIDSEDDQMSIKLGAEYAKSHHYAK